MRNSEPKIEHAVCRSRRIQTPVMKDGIAPHSKHISLECSHQDVSGYSPIGAAVDTGCMDPAGGVEGPLGHAAGEIRD